MATSIAVFYDCYICNGANGVSFAGGSRAVVELGGELRYHRNLYGFVKSVISENAVITRIAFRNPMVTQQGGLIFGLVEIEDDCSVENIYRVMRRFPGLQLIELYVEYNALNVEPTRAYGGAMLNSSQNVAGSYSELLRSFGGPEIPNVRSGNLPNIDHEMPNVQSGNSPHIGGNLPHIEGDSDDGEYEIEEGFHGEGEDEGEDGDECDEEEFFDSEEDCDNDLYQQFLENEKRPADFSALTSVNVDLLVNDLSANVSNVVPWNQDSEFQIGMTFSTRDHVKSAVKLYSVRRKREFCYEETKANTYVVRCNVNDGCQWRLRATQKKNSGVWTITRYTCPHTCVMPSNRVGGRNLDSDLMSNYVSALVEKQPSIQIGALRNYLAERFGVKPSYKAVWRAKQKAITNQFGDWEDSFNMLCPFINAATFFNQGSFWDVEYDVGDQVIPNVRTFRRIFCTYKPCVNAFRHCRPVLCIDGTFTYGKYKMCLLTAEAVDGDNRIFPVAFALVEKENNDNWEYFMDLLRFNVVDQHPCPMDVCIISDRHKGILNAMQSPLWKDNPHRYCIRHIASNFNTAFKNEQLKKMVEQLGREPQKRKFAATMKRLRSQDGEVYGWLRRLRKEKWALAHDNGSRHGIMTTNNAESYNALLKKVRSLPVTAMMKLMFDQLIEIFNKNRQRTEDAISQGDLWTDACMKLVRKRMQKAHGHHVTNYDRINGIMSVTTAFNNSTRKGANVQIVNLNKSSCTCGKFQQDKIPCSHAIAGCILNNMDYRQFISPYFTWQNNKDVWAFCFQPVPDQAYWPTIQLPVIVPDEEWKRKKGRPQSTRIRNEMDWGGRDNFIFCSKCGKTGHNRSSCPRNNR